jgi:transcriptional regulator with XRE-family HTH domain
MNSIKEIRTKLGMRQKDLANFFGCDRSLFSHAEKNKRSLTTSQKEVLMALIQCIPDESTSKVARQIELDINNIKLQNKLPALNVKLDAMQLSFELLSEKLVDARKQSQVYAIAKDHPVSEMIDEFEAKSRNAVTRYRKMSIRHQNLFIAIGVMKARIACIKACLDSNEGVEMPIDAHIDKSSM